MKPKAYKNPLIGEKAKVEYSNKEFKGTIIDETRDTITIRTEEGWENKLIKKNSTIIINSKTIHGSQLTRRPEERIKA